MESLKIKNILEDLFRQFELIGKNSEGKGVTRLGYEKEEDEMHEKFLEIADSYGLNTEIDSAGNSIASNVEPGEKYFLTGSHLDSVIEGGSFDGVLGVLIGLAILIINKEENLNIPLKVIAFRCEESSNFSISTIGSKFFSGADTLENPGKRISKKGITLKETLEKRGFNPVPYYLKDAINFLEVHIEQGRVLESENKTIGLVSDIAGNLRFSLKFKEKNHSESTENDYLDHSLFAAAESILLVERVGNLHEAYLSRATVGVIETYPNSINVNPGETKIDVDIRGIDNEDMDMMFDEISSNIEDLCKTRNIDFEISNVSKMSAVKLDRDIVNKFLDLCKKLDISRKIMPSGAGHDSMNIAPLIPTGMLFIPCDEGISHNPLEDINYDDATKAIRLLIDYYVEEKDVN